MRFWLLAAGFWLLAGNALATVTHYDSIKTSGGDFSTIAAWEEATDVDLVSKDTIFVGVVCNDFTLSANLTISGATTDALRYRMLIAKADSAWDGKTASNHAVITINGNYDLTITENYFKMKYLDWNGNNSGDAIFITNCVNTEFWYCYFHDWDEWMRYYNSSANWGNHYLINCAFEDLDYAAVLVEEYQVWLYNCVVYNCSDNDVNYGAVCVENGRISVTNSIVVSNDIAWYNNDFKIKTGGTGKWLDSRNNVSSDLTCIGGFPCRSMVPDSIFVSTTDGAYDFHLKNTTITRKYIIDRGWYANRDFSTFTMDIDDSTRANILLKQPDTYRWDIGIDEANIQADTQPIRYVRKLADAATKWAGLTPVYSTLDSAIDDSDPWDIIYVASGRYVENIRCSQENIFIYGGFAGTEADLSERQLRKQYMFANPALFTIIDANEDTNCFRTRSGVVLDGFHLRNGIAREGAGFCAKQEGGWPYDQSYSIVRNCRMDSCRSTLATGWGAAVLFDNGPSPGILRAEYCFAQQCSAYCGIMETLSGSETAGQFINCMVMNSDGFGFEISVKDWAYYDDSDNTPGDCWSGAQYTGAPGVCLTTYLPFTDNILHNHRFINCVSLNNQGHHSRSSIPYDPNFQSWAKDQRYISYCYAGASGIVWGDTSTQSPGIGAGVFWSMFAEVEGLLHQDSLADKRLYFADSAGGDFTPTGASPLASSGKGGEYETYMGPIPPITAHIIRAIPMWKRR